MSGRPELEGSPASLGGRSIFPQVARRPRPVPENDPSVLTLVGAGVLAWLALVAAGTFFFG